MKLSMKRNQGFTLIEIIIVVVILGILAAIALPKLTENIDRGRAAEAFSIGAAFGNAMDRCLAVETGGRAATSTEVDLCNTFAEINMQTPVATNFTFTPSSGATTLTLRAQAAFSGNAANVDDITFVYNALTGAVTRTCGSGKFNKLCK